MKTKYVSIKVALNIAYDCFSRYVPSPGSCGLEEDLDKEGRFLDELVSASAKKKKAREHRAKIKREIKRDRKI